MITIKYNFEDGSEPREIQIEPGYTVLEAALLNDIKLNHNCGGVCFIDRARDPRLNSRLSCQCDIMEDNTYIEVIVPDQSTIIAS